MLLGLLMIFECFGLSYREARVTVECQAGQANHM